MNEQPNGNPGTVYHTPQEIIDFLAPQEIIDFLAPCPSIGKLPPGADGSEPEAEETRHGPCALADIPELGITFSRFAVAQYEKYCAAWRNENDAHVYEVTVLRINGRWRAVLANDGSPVCELASASKEVARRCGLAAMRAYLLRGHRKSWRKARAARGS